MIAPENRERELLRAYSAPWQAWAFIFGSVLVIGAIEIPLIFTVTDVLRLQTLNGFWVIAGGSVLFCVSILLVMWPLKRVNIRMLALYLEGQEEHHRIMDQSKRVLDKIESRLDSGLIERLEDKLEKIATRLEDAKPLTPKRRETPSNRESIPSG